MSSEVTVLRPAEREIKRLAKKYPSLKNDLAELFKALMDDPKQGTPLGRGCFKIRLKISSKNAGKSGGGRVISHVLVEDESIYILSVYNKSRQSSISDQDLEALVNEIPGE